MAFTGPSASFTRISSHSVSVFEAQCFRRFWMSQSRARENRTARTRYSSEARYCHRGIPVFRNGSSMPGIWLIQNDNSVLWLWMNCWSITWCVRALALEARSRLLAVVVLVVSAARVRDQRLQTKVAEQRNIPN